MDNRSSTSNVIYQMRRKLTLQYSGVLIFFLALFVVIVYMLLYLLIWNDQQSRLIKLADDEIRILQQWIDREANPNRPPPRSITDAFSISTDQSFYYLVMENGGLQMGSEMQPQLREQVMDLIAKGHFREKQIEKSTLQMIDARSPRGQDDQSIGGEATFLIVDRDLIWKGTRVGKLYVGKEVTFQHNLFRILLILLIGLALLFFVLALWLSHYMSRKAIIPVVKAYDRQREFLADASHELRTPLSVLQASIDALQMEDDKDTSYSIKVIEGMKEEIHSITTLTAELLNVARADSGDVVLHYAPFDVRDLTQSVIEKLRALNEAKGIEVILQAPYELRVNWDVEKLRQLLVLLIENAIKYTPDRGTVFVTIADVMEKGKRLLSIEVKDTGFGISPEALPRIFERFYRQDKSRTRQNGGHGLGLAIAKDIVDTARGTITAVSEEGKGSTFLVRMPLHIMGRSTNE
jgi:signal transduction histidine kinase